MKTVSISKQKLVRAIVVGVILVALVLAGVHLAGSVGRARTSVDEVEEAAARAISEAIRFDHQEGREAWEARVRPLCTDAGWAFWELVGLQTWPQIVEREYAVREIQVLESEMVEDEEDNRQVIVQVRLRAEYAQGGQIEVEEKSYPVTMVLEDGQWLMTIDERAFGGQ